MAKPPSSLPPTTASNPVTVSLLLGSFEHSPAKYELFDLFLPESLPAPQHELEHTFHPQTPIVHTFRPEQKVPPKVISMASAVLVLSPWVVLLGLVRATLHLESLTLTLWTLFSGRRSVRACLTSSPSTSCRLSQPLARSRLSSSGIGSTSNSARFSFMEAYWGCSLPPQANRPLRQKQVYVLAENKYHALIGRINCVTVASAMNFNIYSDARSFSLHTKALRKRTGGWQGDQRLDRFATAKPARTCL